MNGNTRFFNSLTALALALVLTGGVACKRKATGHDHGAAAEPSDHGHDHGAEDRPAISATLVEEGVELFVEYPVLIVGDVSHFGAHLTRLDGHQPVKEGKVELIFTSAKGEQRFSAEVSSTPGIFNLDAKPDVAGEVEVELVWKGPKGEARFDLGVNTVFADLNAASHAVVPEVPKGIAFLKEQQWNAAFATVEVAQRSLLNGFEAFASVQAVPGGEGRVMAPVSGRLEGSGFPSIGQSVRQGQRLGSLVPRAGSDLSLGSVQLDLERAKLKLEQAKVTHTRLKTLLEQDAIPRKRLEDAERELSLAKAEFNVAEARHREITTGRGGMGLSLTAPVSGVVSAVSAGPGIQVSEGQELFHIVDTRKLRLEVQAPETQAGNLSKIASVWFQAPGMEPLVLEAGKNAKVLGSGGAIHLERRTVPLLLEFPNPQGALKVGASGKAFVRTGNAAKSLAVPASALQDEDGLSVVYVQLGGEAFERRIVRVGAKDGQWVQILSGLSEGDRVVTLGAHLVRLAASAAKVPEHGHAH